MRRTLALGFVLVAVAACRTASPPAASAAATTGANEISADGAKAKASAAVPGAVPGEPKSVDEGNEHFWVVDMKMANGRTVVVEVDRKEGVVAEIAGEQGPYDYDFSPGAGYLGLNDARSRALVAKAGEVKAWEIDLQKNEWEIELTGTDHKTYEVKLDAKRGDVTAVKEKKK